MRVGCVAKKGLLVSNFQALVSLPNKSSAWFFGLLPLISPCGKSVLVSLPIPKVYGFPPRILVCWIPHLVAHTLNFTVVARAPSVPPSLFP